MGDELPVPVPLREHECRQLEEFMSSVQQTTDSIDGLDAIYDSTFPISDGRENDEFYAYVSMPVTDWHTVSKALNRHRRFNDGSRSWWLQKKLVNRLNERTEELQ